MSRRRGLVTFIVLDTVGALIAVYGILAIRGIVGTHFAGVVSLALAGMLGLSAVLVLVSALRS